MAGAVGAVGAVNGNGNGNGLSTATAIATTNDDDDDDDGSSLSSFCDSSSSPSSSSSGDNRADDDMEDFAPVSGSVRGRGVRGRGREWERERKRKRGGDGDGDGDGTVLSVRSGRAWSGGWGGSRGEGGRGGKVEVKETKTSKLGIKKTATKVRKRPAKQEVNGDGEVQIHAPDGWEEVYAAVREMRKKGGAPVDTMGCERLAAVEMSPVVSAFLSHVFLAFASPPPPLLRDTNGRQSGSS